MPRPRFDFNVAADCRRQVAATPASPETNADGSPI